MKTIKVGTRQSPLALWQTNYVIEALKQKHSDYQFELVPMCTKGDKFLHVSLDKVGGKGLFTKELETGLLAGSIDFAVHSLKDLPTQLPPGLLIGAVTERHDPREVLISKKGKGFNELPRGARIGTSSLRRKAQLLHHRPDLIMVDLRGNLQTRLKKMESQNLDAIVLAAAGVERLGWQDKITEKLDCSLCLPAAGQGALAIEVREDDELILSLIQGVHDKKTARCVMAERTLLDALEGGCHVPVGALAEEQDEKLYLEAIVGSLDGKVVLREKMYGSCTEPQALGLQVAEHLKKQGAAELLEKAGVCNE